jgi:hypothetical protein
MGDDIGDGAQSGVAREGEAEVAGGGPAGWDGGGSRGGGHGAKAARPSGQGIVQSGDGGYDAVGFRGAEGDTGGGGCEMRGAGRGHGEGCGRPR